MTLIKFFRSVHFCAKTRSHFISYILYNFKTVEDIFAKLGTNIWQCQLMSENWSQNSIYRFLQWLGREDRHGEEGWMLWESEGGGGRRRERHLFFLLFQKLISSVLLFLLTGNSTLSP